MQFHYYVLISNNIFFHSLSFSYFISLKIFIDIKINFIKG